MLKDLTYRVIVIDDEVDLYDDYIEYIERYLTSEGYCLEKQRLEELEELDSEPLDNVDLFLVDLKFGKEDKGPEFIKKFVKNTLQIFFFTLRIRLPFRPTGKVVSMKVFILRSEMKIKTQYFQQFTLCWIR